LPTNLKFYRIIVYDLDVDCSVYNKPIRAYS